MTFILNLFHSFLANSADDKLMTLVSHFPKIMGVDIPCELFIFKKKIAGLHIAVDSASDHKGQGYKTFFHAQFS